MRLVVEDARGVVMSGGSADRERAAAIEVPVSDEYSGNLANARSEGALAQCAATWVDMILQSAHTISRAESLGAVDDPQITDVHILRAVAEDRRGPLTKPGFRYWLTTVLRISSPVLIPVGLWLLESNTAGGVASLIVGVMVGTIAYSADYIERFGRA